MAIASIQNKSLVSIGLIIICAAVGFYVYSNILPNYNTVKAQKSQLQSENQRLQNALSSIKEFLDSYDDISAEASNTHLFLPTDDADVPNFINNLSSIAQVSGVSLDGFQIVENTQQKSGENTIQIVDIGFSSSGSYLALKDFMNKLQTNLRLMDIQTLSVSAAEQNGLGTPLLQIQIKLKTYYQK